MKRRLRLTLWLALLCAGSFVACTDDDAPEGAVHILSTDGSVGPVMERYFDRGIDRAEGNDAVLVVIELDTPGGLTSSMRSIVQRIEASEVPVAVYVWPPGGHAASAGTFITMAGNLAVMAPNTSIGAASVINADGSDIDGALGRKVENDMVAFARGVAELRGRNEDWAESAVRDATAATQTEAVELDVVDYVATDLDDLLAQAEGREIPLTSGAMLTLTGVESAPRVETNMTFWENVLEILADPNIAALLLSLGFLALLFELTNPGMIFPGVLGVAGIILGFIAFDVLPVETGGILLIMLALVLFGLELFLPSGGVLGVVAVALLLFGAVVAFRDTPSDLRPDTWLVAILLAMGGAAFVVATMSVLKVRGLASPSGTTAMLGRTAIARTPLTPEGVVFYNGERWTATAIDEPVQAGERVRIVSAHGLRLRVEKDKDDDTANAPGSSAPTEQG